jgi:hypothetical protein
MGCSHKSKYDNYLKSIYSSLGFVDTYTEEEYSKDSDLNPCAMHLELKNHFKRGGIAETEKDSIYKEWKNLVNMSKSELKDFYDSKEGKEAGLSEGEAKKEGISSGRESARWIMKMKDTKRENWTPTMWKWAKKQISFIKRMSGNKGGLFDDKGDKTRKHTSLLIWGHNPKKMSEGGRLGWKTYTETINGKLYQYFYDREIRLWTIYEIDSEGNQLGGEANHYHDRGQLKDAYNVTFSNDADKKAEGGTTKPSVSYTVSWVADKLLHSKDFNCIYEARAFSREQNEQSNISDVQIHNKLQFKQGGDVMKRYIAEADYYVYAKNDKHAEKKARKITQEIDRKYDNKAVVSNLYEQPFGKLGLRKVLEQGDSLKNNTGNV